MGEKSTQKKNYILETAKGVFAEKGYRSVTMKDIVEACQISRGGLYLYFASTEELFLEVLKSEAQNDAVNFVKSLGEEATAAEVLAMFLKEQKKEIIKSKKSIAAAVYEFLFAGGAAKKDNFYKKQFTDSVNMLSKLIQVGIEEGEFYDVDAKMAAKNMMFVIEGLKISALSMGVSAKTIDEELVLLVQQLVIEE